MIFGETLLPGAPRFPGDVRLYPCVCLCARYEPNDGFRLAEKTSLTSRVRSVVVAYSIEYAKARELAERYEIPLLAADRQAVLAGAH